MTGFSAIVIFGTVPIVLLGDLSVENFYGLVASWGILAFVFFLLKLPRP